MFLRILIILILTTSCSSQIQCSSKQIDNKKITKMNCGPELRVYCWDREKKKGFTDWCQVGYLKTVAKKVHNYNITALVCEQKNPKWSYDIPWDQACEIVEETVCKLK